MESVQGIQGHQANQTLNNDIYGSTGGNSQSSYVSSSGIKSILSNAWNAIKSAFSNVISAFGSHLCGQQGSEKPGRDIVMDVSSRSAQPLPDMDAQLENSIYESSGENIYNAADAYAAFGRPENLYASVSLFVHWLHRRYRSHHVRHYLNLFTAKLKNRCMRK